MQIDSQDLVRVQNGIEKSRDEANEARESLSLFFEGDNDDDNDGTFNDLGERIDFTDGNLVTAAASYTGTIFEKLAELHALGIVQGALEEALDDYSETGEPVEIEDLLDDLSLRLAHTVIIGKIKYGKAGPLADAYQNLVTFNCARSVAVYSDLLKAADALYPQAMAVSPQLGIDPGEVIKRAKDGDKMVQKALGLAAWEETKAKIRAHGLPVPPMPIDLRNAIGASAEEGAGDPGVPDLSFLLGSMGRPMPRVGAVPPEVNSLAKEIAAKLGIRDVDVVETAPGVFTATGAHVELLSGEPLRH